jgi:hypothetical protein
VVFELSVDPESQVSVKDKSELIALFPENYEFLGVSDKRSLMTGEYFLEPILDELRFDKKQQFDLVVFPTEKKMHVFLHGPVELK